MLVRTTVIPLKNFYFIYSCDISLCHLDASHHTATSHTCLDWCIMGSYLSPDCHALISCILHTVRAPKFPANVDDTVEQFNNALISFLDTYVPVKTRRVTRSPSSWMTQGTLSLMPQRDAAYQQNENSLKSDKETTTKHHET
ncbi:hypothetical protein PR048_000326 [Dryococelus australis]|uniref:Uncharacterized protein n=1 Tax=Dryococelus australis TaxID=614101 RepID=A0ABQ9IEA9_9NEOP|nr:hypothetical protein PR048_000326 [Dryococelus australis]